MRGHNLMQAIARVNRVFKDKPGGLIVDYIGIASDLKSALAAYTASGRKGAPTLDQEEAVNAFANSRLLTRCLIILIMRDFSLPVLKKTCHNFGSPGIYPRPR